MELKIPENEIEFKASVNDNGNVVLKKKSNIKRGSKSRSCGSVFELRVRKDLEKKGWIVDKWSNNLSKKNDSDESNSKLFMHSAKRRFARLNTNMGVMTIGTGFPDFVCFEKRGDLYKIIGIEVKINGRLSKIEKDKCAWYLKNEIFSEILIAEKLKIKNRVYIKYVNVSEILGRMKK